jgi:tetratricopeptide (TPR) repeat protein
MKNYDYIEADDYFDMAVGWIRSRNYEKALNYLNRTIDLNPNFIYAYIALGRVYALQKRFPDAAHALKRATRLDPEFDRLYYLAAKYFYKNGDFKNALIYINRALAIDDKALYKLTRYYIENNWAPYNE